MWVILMAALSAALSGRPMVVQWAATMGHTTAEQLALPMAVLWDTWRVGQMVALWAR
jgi:hypothetical protein